MFKLDIFYLCLEIMVVKPETQDRVRHLLQQAIPALLKSGLSSECDFAVEGLIGVTMNTKDVFLVSVKETIKAGAELDSDGNEESCDGSYVTAVIPTDVPKKPSRKRGRPRIHKPLDDAPPDDEGRHLADDRSI